MLDPRYLTGIDCFNRGDYFDAHEVWEELWLDCASAERRFYQSLIQAAVAIYHFERGNGAGATRLLRSGKRYMEPFRPSYLSLDVDDFWRQVEAYLAANPAGNTPRPVIVLGQAYGMRSESQLSESLFEPKSALEYHSGPDGIPSSPPILGGNMAHTVTFKGNSVTLAGSELKPGSQAPNFTTLNVLTPVSLADTPKKARLFSVVPSLDTAVCSTQTKKFDDGIKALGDKVACYTVSVDLPFAQKRFCSAENITAMQTLSDVHDHSFGKNWGVLIESGLPLPLLARAVFVVDANNKITYAEYVPEVTSHPNYEAALTALQAAAN